MILQKGHRLRLLFGSFFGMIKTEIGKYLLKGVLLPMKTFAKIISFVVLTGALASLIKVLIDFFYDKCEKKEDRLRLLKKPPPYTLGRLLLPDGKRGYKKTV